MTNVNKSAIRIVMGDMGDFWRDVKPFIKERSNEKKRRNLENALKSLKDNNISYEEKSNGIHLVVEGKIDYWPTTGKFIRRSDKKQGRGIRNLVRVVKENYE